MKNADQLVDEIHQLPKIPQVVQELISSFEDTNADIDEIAKKISMDQVIVAKVLRLANSARFGGTRKVASIEDAVIRLGFNVLRTLVVASGVSSSFSNVNGIDKKNFWNTTFSVACVAKELAHFVRSDEEIAFTCGMLHNIGEMLLYIGMPEAMHQIETRIENGESRIVLQQGMFGFNYADVGAELANRWNFPESIEKLIRFQRQPEVFKGENQTLATLLALAIQIVEYYKEIRHEEVDALLLKRLGLDVISYRENLSDWLEMGEEFSKLLDA